MQTPKLFPLFDEDENEYQNYQENYFLRKLDSLERFNEDDIFTNVNDYRSIDTIYIDEDDNRNYNPNQPWGYNDNNDVVININANPYWNDPWLWNNGWNNWGFNNWGWGFNNWGWNNWGWNNGWGFRNRFWGVNPYWHPYHNFGWRGGFIAGWGWNNRFFNNGFNNRFYRNI